MATKPTKKETPNRSFWGGFAGAVGGALAGAVKPFEIFGRVVFNKIRDFRNPKTFWSGYTGEPAVVAEKKRKAVGRTFGGAIIGATLFTYFTYVTAGVLAITTAAAASAAAVVAAPVLAGICGAGAIYGAIKGGIEGSKAKSPYEGFKGGFYSTLTPSGHEKDIKAEFQTKEWLEHDKVIQSAEDIEQEENELRRQSMFREAYENDEDISDYVAERKDKAENKTKNEFSERITHLDTQASKSSQNVVSDKLSDKQSTPSFENSKITTSPTAKDALTKFAPKDSAEMKAALDEKQYKDAVNNMRQNIEQFKEKSHPLYNGITNPDVSGKVILKQASTNNESVCEFNKEMNAPITTVKGKPISDEMIMCSIHSSHLLGPQVINKCKPDTALRCLIAAKLIQSEAVGSNKAEYTIDSTILDKIKADDKLNKNYNRIMQMTPQQLQEYSKEKRALSAEIPDKYENRPKDDNPPVAKKGSKLN